MQFRLRLLWLTFILLSMVLGMTAACRQQGPVYLGYVGSLSGRASELARAGRNGVYLAVEEINRHGGVNGRKVELLVRDNQGVGAQAAVATRELIDSGCVAIIGHMLSQMSVEAVPELEGHDVVMVSPTTATSELSGIDDQFLRVYPDLRKLSARLARHVYREKGLRHIAIVGDSDNRAFSQPWMESFSEYFRAEGGTISLQQYFSSSGKSSFSSVVAPLLEARSEGVLIIANAPDTGMLCQQLRKAGSRIPVFTAEWSFAGDLLRYGGRAVEGLTLFHSFDVSSDQFEYRRFVEAYRDEFATAPGFAAVNAYDATRLVLQALLRQKPEESLKQTLLEQEDFKGVQVAMHLDRFGDIERPLFLTSIVNGAFRRIGEP